MYFFTADEHYFHKNIIKYTDRPFSSVQEMNKILIKNHNELVTIDDTTIHAGDFALVNNTEEAVNIINQLNGKHIFLKGSHDRWMKNKKNYHEIFEKRIDGKLIVICHYAMRTWAASHWNSWHLFGHSHGTLVPEGKSWDIGVDNNNFYPLSFEQVKEIMEKRPDNCGLIKKP